MSVLITGGCGLIGSTLARMLVARGESVAVFDQAQRPWRFTGIEAGPLGGGACGCHPGGLSRGADRVQARRVRHGTTPLMIEDFARELRSHPERYGRKGS